MLFLDLLTHEDAVRLDNLSTLYYMAPLACGFIAVGFFVLEYPTLNLSSYTYTDPQSQQLVEAAFPAYLPVLLIVNAALAFALNLSIVLFVSNVGIMSMTLAGILKDVLVVLLSVLLFGAFSRVSFMQIIGYSLSLLGLVVYKELKTADGRLSSTCARMQTMLCGWGTTDTGLWQSIPHVSHATTSPAKPSGRWHVRTKIVSDFFSTVSRELKLYCCLCRICVGDGTNASHSASASDMSSTDRNVSDHEYIYNSVLSTEDESVTGIEMHDMSLEDPDLSDNGNNPFSQQRGLA